MQYTPDLERLASPHSNMFARVDLIRSCPSNQSWCSFVGKMNKRQHAYHFDGIRRKVHDVL
eukprot:6193175-Karenia_brevis.AAC.1